MHIFDQAIKLNKKSQGLSVGATTPEYQNMVGPYGGALCAILLNAVMIDERRIGDPISVTVHFAAPVAEGEFEVKATAVRTNRSTQHWLVELIQGGEVAVYGTVFTGIRRETWGDGEIRFPAVPEPETITHGFHVTLPWTKAYDFKFIEGGPQTPAIENKPSQTRMWIRDEPPRKLDFVSLSSICDAFFPRIFLKRGYRVPIGTVVLTTHFHVSQEQINQVGDGYLLGTADAKTYGKGYFDQSSELWSKDGVLLATSHQMVYYKE